MSSLLRRFLEYRIGDDLVEPVMVEVDVCSTCRHARDEQGREELPEMLGRWMRTLRKQPTPPAACLSTVDPEDGQWHGRQPCPCRSPFHGS